MFEENRRGSMAELAKHYSLSAPKGEIVITVAGARQHEETNPEPEED
jgi:16S rRNA C1402 (ribose-2'-O) methylase RsmI